MHIMSVLYFKKYTCFSHLNRNRSCVTTSLEEIKENNQGTAIKICVCQTLCVLGFVYTFVCVRVRPCCLWRSMRRLRSQTTTHACCVCVCVCVTSSHFLCSVAAFYLPLHPPPPSATPYQPMHYSLCCGL